MDGWELWTLVFTIIAIVTAFSYFGVFGYILDYLIKILVKYAGNKLGMQGLDVLLSSALQTLKTPIEDQFNIFDGYAVINYNHSGKSRRMFLPYSPRIPPIYNQINVFLMKDGKRIDITQQPGVPYLISAKSLGGDGILVRGNNKEITLPSDGIPTDTVLNGLFI